MSIPKRAFKINATRPQQQADLNTKPEPFADSTRRPTREQREVATLIFRHTRRTPIRIDQICGATSLTKRQAQGVIESLRAVHHLPIGASKRIPRGYFWIRDAADLEVALRNFLNPAKKMLATARAFAPLHLRAELRGQLVLFVSEDDRAER
jgi:hypothetical protein